MCHLATVLRCDYRESNVEPIMEGFILESDSNLFLLLVYELADTAVIALWDCLSFSVSCYCGGPEKRSDLFQIYHF